MPGRIAVTPRSLSAAGHPALDRLRQRGYDVIFPAPGKTPSEDDLLSSIPGCVGWLAGVEPISNRVLDAAGDLKVISRNGTGVDNIDLASAKARGIAVERAMGANARGVAELAIGMLFAAFRHVPWSDARLHAGRWERRIGTEVRGRTLGVIGCGAIGREVARLALGLDMQVLAYDPYPVNDVAASGFRFAPLDDVLRGSAAVTLHCPPRDRPILDHAAIAAMRDNAVVINTARAELVDDAAMLDALNTGRISAYATDVFHREPPEPSELLAHDRVITTPHIGGYTEESIERATEAAIENLLKVLESRCGN